MKNNDLSTGIACFSVSHPGILNLHFRLAHFMLTVDRSFTPLAQLSGVKKNIKKNNR